MAKEWDGVRSPFDHAAPADKQGGGLEDAIAGFICNWIEAKEHYPKAEAELRAVLARVAPSDPAPADLLQAIRDEIGPDLFDMQSVGTWLRVADVVRRKTYAAPQPSVQQPAEGRL